MASGPGNSMQNDRAERYSSSLTHLRSSTISRCMRAICAAGPPNDKSPMRPKALKRTAQSVKRACLRACRGPRQTHRAPNGTARRKEGHPHRQLIQIVAVLARQPNRDRQKPGRLRCQIVPVDLGPLARHPQIAGHGVLRNHRQASLGRGNRSAGQSTSTAIPCVRSRAAPPFVSLRPLAQTTTTRRACNRAGAGSQRSWAMRELPGIRRGSRAKSSGSRTSIMAGASGRPIRRAS